MDSCTAVRQTDGQTEEHPTVIVRGCDVGRTSPRAISTLKIKRSTAIFKPTDQKYTRRTTVIPAPSGELTVELYASRWLAGSADDK